MHVWELEGLYFTNLCLGIFSHLRCVSCHWAKSFPIILITILGANFLYKIWAILHLSWWPEINYNFRFYGCGLVAPESLEDMHILDLGSGSGQDCFVLSKLVGENGHVTGVDMTKEQVWSLFSLPDLPLPLSWLSLYMRNKWLWENMIWLARIYQSECQSSQLFLRDTVTPDV